MKRKFFGVDLKLIGLLAIFYTAFNIVYLIKLIYIRSTATKPPERSLLDVFLNNILFDWTVVMLFMTVMAISTKKLIEKRYSWKSIIALHLAMSIVIGMVIRILGDAFEIVLGDMDLSTYDFKSSFFRFIYVSDLNFLIYFAMICIIYSYFYLKQVREAEQQHAALQTQLVDAKMKVLRSQLQPHFLFNTLNGISSLIEINAKKAQNTIADLSNFLREVLYRTEEQMITIESELRTLAYYLDILHVRFSDHLSIEKDIDSSLMQEKIPALLIQPIIENSVKYGYSMDHTSLTIKLRIAAKGKRLIIVVENDGKLLEENPLLLMQKGIGLSNIKERLTNIYGDNYVFTIRNKAANNGVETFINLPMQ